MWCLVLSVLGDLNVGSGPVIAGRLLVPADVMSERHFAVEGECVEDVEYVESSVHCSLRGQGVLFSGRFGLCCGGHCSLLFSQFSGELTSHSLPREGQVSGDSGVMVGETIQNGVKRGKDDTAHLAASHSQCTSGWLKKRLS